MSQAVSGQKKKLICKYYAVSFNNMSIKAMTKLLFRLQTPTSCLQLSLAAPISFYRTLGNPIGKAML